MIRPVHEVRDGLAGYVAGHAEADGDVDLGARARKEGVFLEGAADAFGHARRLFPVGGRQDDDEFLAPVAVGGIGVADEFLNDAPELREHGVAAEVAVGVVVLLEMVDIQDTDGQGAVVAHGAVHLGLHLPEEMPGVIEAREFVRQAEFAVAHLAAAQVLLDALAGEDLLAQFLGAPQHLLLQMLAVQPVLLPQPPLLQALFHGMQDKFEIDQGLDQEVPGAPAQGLDDVVHGSGAGDDDHGRLLVTGRDVPEHVEA